MRLFTRATSACDGGQPPVGRPCGTAEKSGIKTKTFHEKEKTKPSQPEAQSSLPLVGPETVADKSRFRKRRPAYLMVFLKAAPQRDPASENKNLP